MSRRHLRPATGAIVGRRLEQQDMVLAEPVEGGAGEPGILLVVADGMGGHAGGQLASATAVETFRSAWRMGGQLPPAERLRAALEIANRAIGLRVAERPELHGMGCTLVAALVFGDRVRWISVGDSLLLAIRDGQSIRLNADHSMAPEIDRAAMEGRISRAQAENDPDRHVLLSALNGGRIEMIDEGERRLGAGALVLLATDGLLTLPASRIAELGSGARPTGQKVAALLAAIVADMPPDQDNTSLAAVHCGAPLKAGAGRPAARVWLGLLLLALASAGGGYAAWLLNRADGPEPTRAAPSSPPPVPAANGGDGSLGRRGPVIEQRHAPSRPASRAAAPRPRPDRPAPPRTRTPAAPVAPSATAPPAATRPAATPPAATRPAATRERK